MDGALVQRALRLTEKKGQIIERKIDEDQDQCKLKCNVSENRSELIINETEMNGALPVGKGPKNKSKLALRDVKKQTRRLKMRNNSKPKEE